MGRMAILRLASVLGLVLASAAVRAQIRVDGFAERSVAADAIELVLELSTGLDSYSTSYAAMDGLIEDIRAMAAPPCDGEGAAVQVEVSAGEPIRGSTALPLHHRLLVRCPVDPRHVEASAAILLDGVLALHPGLSLDDVTGTVSPERDREVREALLAEAVDAAWGLAKAAARAGGSEVVRLVSIEAAPTGGFYPGRRRHGPHRPVRVRTQGAAVRVEATPGFSGTRAFSGILRYAARVVAEFELSE